MAIQVQQGTTAIGTFETLTKEHGARVAPDTAPTVAYVHVNGAINSGLTPTIEVMQNSTPADITGYYKITFDTSSLSTQDDVHIAISAEISGTTVTKVLHFLIIDQPNQLPVIR